jgi:hypothetical protein
VRRQRIAQALTILMLTAALGVAVARQKGWKMPGWSDLAWSASRFRPAAEATPQDAIYAMLDAAREGDVKKYLAAGVAVTTPEFAPGDREVSVRVEYVYQDRNEAQTMNLEKTAGGWKIARVDSAERVKTLVPYGTPVQ